MRYKYTATEKVLIWLDSFRDITYGQKQKILAFLSEPTELVKDFSEYTDVLLSILNQNQYEEMRASLENAEYLTKILGELETRDMFFVTPWSIDYPAQLRETTVPPLVLYCKGNRELLKTRCFSAVGSRKTLPWAQALAGEVAAELSKEFTLVTGLADGGDRAVIDGVLKSARDEKVNLISVIAHGMDYVYPAGHDSLLKEIARRGLVVSEYPPQIKPQKYYFPVRNRIIAGMGRGVLVVSAGERSGAAITAGYAAEYGRDVFAFPYNPNVPSGAGCNNLIKTGAMLVTGAADIFSVYGIEIKEEVKDKKPPLQGEEKEIYDFISENDGAHVEEIAAHCKKPSYALSGTLSALEVKGFIVRMGGNRYAVAKSETK